MRLAGGVLVYFLQYTLRWPGKYEQNRVLFFLMK
jgi:hypothetical protein